MLQSHSLNGVAMFWGEGVGVGLGVQHRAGIVSGMMSFWMYRFST